MRAMRARSIVMLLTVAVVCACSAHSGGTRLSRATSASGGAAATAAGRPAPAWALVAVGDSLAQPRPQQCAGCVGYPALYGRAVHEATGMRVTVINRATPSIDSAQLLAQVRGDSSLRAELARADIITVTIGHNDTPWVSDNDPCDGSRSRDHANWGKYTPACVATTARRLRGNLGQVLGELAKLRAGKPTAIRVTNFYNDNMKDPLADPGGDAASKYVVDTYSAAICQVAQANHAACADIYHAFNGAHGTQFDGPYVAGDHVHPSAAGQQLIAHVLQSLGYAPLR
jgi:acyl-CoA thioesterase-1